MFPKHPQSGVSQWRVVFLLSVFCQGWCFLVGGTASVSQEPDDSTWAMAEHQKDNQLLGIQATRLPMADLLSLSHDTDTQDQIAKEVASPPGGQKTVLTPPFSRPSTGIWQVIQGQLDILSHRRGTSNAFAWDFVLMDDKFRQTDSTKSGNESHYCWDKPVLAPAAGIVRKLNNTAPDHAPSAIPKDNGNWVILDHMNGESSALWHFKQGSISVKEGQRVRRGQFLGRCGNSGSSLFPHIHMQLDKIDPVTFKRSFAPAVLGIFLSGKEGDTLEKNKSPRRGSYITPLNWPYERPYGL